MAIITDRKAKVGYAARGIADFARALWERWEDGDRQAEGRPDAGAEAVSIITMHSAKGLEWPIVIPINSTTTLWSDLSFLYRRRDNSVHFKVFGFPSPDYDSVHQAEAEELRRERVRLWYVALTRARDLLLLPRQSERVPGDWLSLVTLDLEALPLFDATRFEGVSDRSSTGTTNAQDLATWEREAAAIAAAEQRIVWRVPSRHEGVEVPVEGSAEVFTDAETFLEGLPDMEERTIQGGRERGLVLHKLMEEVLTGETPEDGEGLRARAGELLAQLGVPDAEDPAEGPSSGEMAVAVRNTLQLPEIAEMRSRMLPELPVYAATVEDKTMTLTAGIADAVVADATGGVEAVVDWKSDVDPTPAQVEVYRRQVGDYMAATGARLGLIVFMTSGRVERVGM